LTFLDAHLRCGNSLIGAPLRNHEGRFDQFSISLLPTEAYSKPPEVDSKGYGQLLNRLKTENRKQISQLQAGQKTIFSGDEERHILPNTNSNGYKWKNQMRIKVLRKL
jgi:hypothetical protein